MPKKSSAKEIMKKYSKRLEDDLGNTPVETTTSYSQDYETFKTEMIPQLSRYEKWCQSLGNIIKIKIAEKDRTKVEKHLKTAHLNVTPSQAVSLAVVSLLTLFFLTLLTATALFLILENPPIGNILLFSFLGIIFSLFIFYYLYSEPERMALTWRLKASSQMVPAVLYMVVFMKHTSNLERAISFASKHLTGPLALDFKKVFYDVEIGKFPTIKKALDSYLEQWREYAPEFIESIHLIESSLYEPSNARRIKVLEKSLQVILDGVYDKMLKFSHNVRSPLTNIYMLGIVLPTLGLALLPLASALIGNLINWQIIFILFNILIPFFVFYMTSKVMLTRPCGYGEATVIEKSPDYHLFKSKTPYITVAIIAIPLLIIGLLPFLMQTSFIQNTLGLESDYTIKAIGLQLFDFKDVDNGKVGPFSPLAVLFSFFIPLSIALFFSYAYKKKTSKLIKASENTKKLEKEFTNSIFQLGNRLGDGIPAEMAFGKVAQTSQGSQTQKFFAIVNQNIQQFGMSAEKALFDKQRGALLYFPSPLIATTMRIMIESVKKGLKVASESLMAISQYIKNIQKITQRLQDLLAEIISDMRSNMTFLAPLLSGIVVGLATMITSILNKLKDLKLAVSGSASTQAGGFAKFINIFDITQVVPPYFLQIIVGIYIIEIVFILTKTLVTVSSGKDELLEKHELGKNLIKATMLYLITAIIATTALTALSTIVLNQM